MPPYGPHYQKDSSICWECLGLDLTVLNPSAPIPSVPSAINHDLFFLHVPWSKINDACATCLRIKALLQPHPSTIAEVVDSQSPQPRVLVEFKRPYSASFRTKTENFICLNYTLILSSTDLQVVSFIPTRNLKPKPNTPDLQAIRFLLDQCRKDHTGICGQLSRPRDFSLRVIDSSKRTLHEIPPGAQTPYVCLSYLWGKGAINAVSEDHTLENLPKTIGDAVFVANELGIPYLWVDRYCISHSNPAEREFLIKRMDMIYEGAALTIIAAAGDGPMDGLPGIHRTPRSCSDQYVFHVEEPSMTLVAVLDPAVEIQYSLWATRGWTFQEMFLSRRRLLFTESQIYFQCDSGHCIEALDAETTDKLTACHYLSQHSAKFHYRKVAAVYQRPPDPNMIWNRLQDYYPRALTFDADIIAAFDGIYGAFKRHGHALNHFYGLLLCEDIAPDQLNTSLLTFVTSLSWYLNYRYSPRLQYKSSIYPSWTWAHSMGSQRVERGQMHLAPTMQIMRPDSCDCAITIERRDGRRIGLDTLLKEGLDYKDFYPWIDLEAWAAPGTLIPKENYLGFRISAFTSLYSPGLRLDYDFPHVKTEILIICVGGDDFGFTSYLIVAREQDGSGYRRLGFHKIYHGGGDKKGLSGIEYLNLVAPGANWERRTVRLV